MRGWLVFQLAAFNATCIFSVGMISYYAPYKDRTENRQQMLNELSLVIIVSLLLAQGEFSNNDESRQLDGWFIIIVISFVIIWNYLLILKNTTVEACWRVKIWKMKRVFAKKMQELAEMRFQIRLNKDIEAKTKPLKTQKKALEVIVEGEGESSSERALESAKQADKTQLVMVKTKNAINLHAVDNQSASIDLEEISQIDCNINLGASSGTAKMIENKDKPSVDSLLISPASTIPNVGANDGHIDSLLIEDVDKNFDSLLGDEALLEDEALDFPLSTIAHEKNQRIGCEQA